MDFRAIIKDAKLTAHGVNIHMVGGDDLSTDELRAYFDEAVLVHVEIICPSTEVDSDGWEIEGE